MLNILNLPFCGKYILVSILVFILSNTINSNAYKLNVPKVLLPFHSTKLITFQLEANGEAETTNDDLCFVWSSSRPDVVTITPIYDSNSKRTNECSNKAIVAAVSKHPQRLTSIILAKETKTDKLIRCDVIVDRIEKIRIKHTTTHLYLEDSPEAFTAEALDSEGNTFSSLEGLPFEWSIINDPNDINNNFTSLDSRNVLRISKFIESEYQVTESIRQLESIGLSGHKILIEGLKTGTANVQAKLLDSFYKETLKTPLVRLLVVANILIEPSYPVYILVGAHVKYSVFLIKQTNIEKISLPSLQYYFESRNKSTADLIAYDNGQVDPSTICGLNVGTVEITLIDRNMKEQLFVKTSDQYTNVESKVAVPPPTALVHVVHPDHLYFEIKNWRSSWILQVGRTYEIMILVNTAQRNQIYPSDNLQIESLFDKTKFNINLQSKNGSYHVVTVLERGLTQARASLKGTVQLGDKFNPFEFVARGQQDMELLDPIDVNPKLLIFAFFPGMAYNEYTPAYEYLLMATGGSDSYYWKSLNSTIATVSQTGMIKTTATRLGKSQILVSDTRNIDIYAKSLVYILEPIDLQLQVCPVETQLGNKLFINIEMNADLNNLADSELDEISSTIPLMSKKIAPINDCSRLKFDVKIKNEKMFKFVSIQSPSSILTIAKNHPIKNACAVIILEALEVGRTSILVTTSTISQNNVALTNNYEHLIKLQSNELLIGSYSPLKSQKSLITLARESSLIVNLYDGPLLSSSTDQKIESTTSYDLYSQETKISDESLVEVTPIEFDYQPNRYSYNVKCKKVTKQQQQQDDVVNVKFSIWHRKSTLNKCPVVFDFQIEVRCAQPHSLQLNQLLVNNEEANVDQVSLISKWKCPIKLSSNLLIANLEHPLLVQIQVKDALNNIFDNFTSLNFDWEIQNKKLLELSNQKIKYVDLSALEDRTGLVMLANTVANAASNEKLNRNRLFYQMFTINSKQVNKNSNGNDTKLTVKMYLMPNDNKIVLSKTLSIQFVSNVKVQPDSLTIFNHPSNVITLALFNGSGHYQAEIETIKVEQLNSDIDTSSTSANVGSVLKINQITDHGIVVSPLLNNGLTLMHVYDYCIPPLINFFVKKDLEYLAKNELIIWPPATTAKIQVAGINSILVYYEDEKFQINTQLKVYVQISDATGNLIKTKYFPLMSLKAKLSNSKSSLDKSGESDDKLGSNNSNILLDNELYATISPLLLDEYANLDLNEHDKEYTAVYTMNAIKEGIVSIFFEAHSDGYFENPKSHSSFSKLIRSPLKDIQIFSPLNIQPKHIELIHGANYQIITSGGPNTPDSSIKYEMVNMNAEKKSKKIIEINGNGIVEAFEVGQVKVLAKSLGHACKPFSHLATISSMSIFRCNSENRVERVYSEDYLIVKVVELRSIHIQTPLKSIKRGNEMQIYLMGNEHQLSPLNFGSCANLKYTWKVNDPELAILYNPLLDESKDSNSAVVDDSVFDTSFSLRLLARKSGTVKVTIRVEYRNNGNNKGLSNQLTDSIDIVIFENAYFNHMPFSHFMFKNPQIFKNRNKLDFYQLVQMQQQQNVVLMSPGSQLQVKTNLDKLARKIHYELAFFDELTKSSQIESKYCNNNTIMINHEGLITTTPFSQHELKKFELCTSTLLVTIELLQQQQLIKKQTLVYTILVKPIAYSMIKLNNNVASTSSFSKNRINSKALLNTKFVLNDKSGIQIKWHVKYYDNLGDVFDVINLNNEFTLNRNDLVDFSNLNSNLFINANTNKGKVFISSSSKGETDTSDPALTKQSQKINPMLLLTNSVENSFSTKIIKAGRFIMELTPFSSNSKQSRDYLGLTIDSLSIVDGGYENFNSITKLEANVGDILCLNAVKSYDDFEEQFEFNGEENFSEQKNKILKWESQTPRIIKLFTEETPIERFYFGVCLSKGYNTITRSNNLDSSNLIEINVKPIETIKFITHSSAKYITNQQSNEESREKPNQRVQFKVGSSLFSLNQNCTDQFEEFFKSKQASGWSKISEMIPFKCAASLYSQTGKHITYLDRLVSNNIVFKDAHWTCNIDFTSNSNILLYELLERNIDRPSTSKAEEFEKSLDEINMNNEPAKIRVYIQSKFNDVSHGDNGEDGNYASKNSLLNKYYELPFIPAFYIQTKKIELPIIRHSYNSINSFSLVIMATRQLHSHLIVTSNCPQYIQIKQSNNKNSKNKDIDSITTITFEIMNIQTKFDFNSFALLMDQQNGHFYIQVASSLTQQIEKIPIKFLAPNNIDLTLYSADQERLAYSQNREQQRSSSHIYNALGWFVDFPPNQIITFLVMVSILLVSILFLLKLKSPTQQSAEQIALNASAAAAAVIAANSYRSSPGSAIKEHSSFNPYRYFTSNPDVQTYESSPKMKFSKINTSFSDRSPTNLSFRNQSYKLEPSDRSNYMPISPRGQSRLNTTDRDGIQLYSRNLDDTSPYSETNTFGLFQRHPNQQYDSSDNEETRQQERRVPPRNFYA